MASALKALFSKKTAVGVALAATMTFATLPVADVANAEAPPTGSPQYNMGRAYKDFITKMYNRQGGWCCDWSDGRANLEERIIPGTNGGHDHYQVKITREAFEYDETIPAEGRWIDIPDDRVLNGDDAERICKPVRAGDPNSSCKQPPFNILWRSKWDNVYCYWPKPQLG